MPIIAEPIDDQPEAEAGFQPSAPQAGIAWYRSPVSRDDLRELSQRSNAKGFAQTLGFLGWLAFIGFIACYSAGRIAWPLTVLLIFIHGIGWGFVVNGFHELIHNSVFQIRWLNSFFARIFGFMGWFNPHYFWASHTAHHKFTLHPPDDLEVVLPYKKPLLDFFKHGIVTPWNLYLNIRTNLRLARGKLSGEWENILFPATEPQKCRDLFNWARLLLIGHAFIVIIFFALGWWLDRRWWLVPIVTTLAPYYGMFLHLLCNHTQHLGLQDDVSDFRLCCRTITLNPFLEFLYWHMNFHTEHHMYASVPCYNLSKLHNLIKNDLPPCPHGLIATWREIIPIVRRQAEDPTYQYIAVLPASRS